MHHSFLDRYSDLASPIHFLDARLKCVCVLLAVIFIAAVPLSGFPILGAVMALLILLWFAAKIPFLYLLRRLAIAAPFVIIISLGAMWGTGHGGAVIFGRIVKAMLCIMTISLLTSTTPFPKLLEAFRKLWVPNIFIELIAFLYRFTYILIDEFERLEVARKGREFANKIGIVWRGRAWMMGTFLIRSIERSERVYQAMLARGYDGNIKQ